MHLSAKQRAVAELLARGLSPAQIARRLGVKETTVYTHTLAVAWKIPNPEGAPKSRLVAVWAARNLA